MGIFFNPGNGSFTKDRNYEIYVDKTELLKYLNRAIGTPGNCIAVSHARRFGKSHAAGMIDAYYSLGSDSAKLFKGTKIASDPDYEKYRNKYNVIHLDISSFWDFHKKDIVEKIIEDIFKELKMDYPEEFNERDRISYVLIKIYEKTGIPFVIIIDEWDVLIRDESANKKVQDEYIRFLRGMFKGTEPTKYIQLAYLTGILPIKKEKTQSALNNFREYSMLNAGCLASYIGFTEDEVKALCETYKKDFTEVKRWYDGYQLGKYHIYNPNVVVNLMADESFQSYWSGTASYDSIVPLINMDFDGLKTAIIEMVSGASVEVDVGSFQNDVENIVNKDDVLTYLIHMGYLAYSSVNRMAFVPNEEIRQELIRATKRKEWNEMLKFQQESEDLLDATLDMDGEIVAAQIEKIHEEYVSAIQYNNENSLSSVLALAYLSAMQYYFKPVREFPTGRGFADFVFIPKTEYRNDYPALVVELKWNKSAVSALQQIKDKKYPDSIQKYAGNILLVGINYSKKEKKHECVIEEYLKK